MIHVHLLHLTLAAETAVFLVACLAFLASFAALLIDRKRGTVIRVCRSLFLCLSSAKTPQDQESNTSFQV